MHGSGNNGSRGAEEIGMRPSGLEKSPEGRGFEMCKNVVSGDAKNYLLHTFLPNTAKCSPCIRHDGETEGILNAFSRLK